MYERVQYLQKHVLSRQGGGRGVALIECKLVNCYYFVAAARRIGKVIQGNPIGSVSDTIDYKPYNLEAMFTTSITICMLGVKVRNMKMDFNTGDTWCWVGQ